MADKAWAETGLLQSNAAATADGRLFDVGGLSAVGLQVTGITTATITVEATVDGVTWVALPVLNLNSLVSGATVTANGFYACFFVGADQLRARISAYTSGSITVTAKAVGKAEGITLIAGLAGAAAIPVDTELPAAAALADAASATPTTPTVGNIPLLMNATTVDRQRAVVAGLDSTGTGIAAAGLVGQLDDTATTAVTENQFAVARLSTRRALLIEGVASGTNINVNLAASAATVTIDSELPVAAALADAASAAPTTPTVGSIGLLMNATTVDRARAVVNALDSAGTGIAAAGLIGQLDDTATSSVTENQFAVARISTRRALLVEGVASGTNLNVAIAASSATVTIDSELPAAAALADAASATPTTPTVGAVPLLMNATTIDRQRAVVAGLDSTGTGIAAAGLVGQLDDTATSSVTENQFAVARISTRRALLVEGVASGTNLNVNLAASAATVTVDTEMAAAGALADAASAAPTTATVGAVPLLMNATTIDRQRAVVAGLDSTGTGIAAAGLVGQLDDTATTAVTENQFAVARLSTRRALLVEGVTSGTNLNVNLAASAATVTIDSELPAAAALADAAAAAPTTPTVGSIGLLMNATTVDRARAVVNALDSAGTGIAAAGLVGQLDDTATSSVTENQFAVARISTRRALLVEGVASGTNLNVNLAASAATVTVDSELPAAAALADAASAAPTAPTVGSIGLLMNATTVDRQRAVVNALDSTGIGIAACGLVGQLDNTTPSTVTENQFGAVRINTVRQVMTAQYAATGTQTSVVAAAVDTSLLAANAPRLGAIVYNDSTAILYLLAASGVASTTVYTVQVPANGTYEVAFGYTGAIRGYWASATGNARVTEYV